MSSSVALSHVVLSLLMSSSVAFLSLSSFSPSFSLCFESAELLMNELSDEPLDEFLLAKISDELSDELLFSGELLSGTRS